VDVALVAPRQNNARCELCSHAALTLISILQAVRQSPPSMADAFQRVSTEGWRTRFGHELRPCLLGRLQAWRIPLHRTLQTAAYPAETSEYSLRIGLDRRLRAAHSDVRSGGQAWLVPFTLWMIFHGRFQGFVSANDKVGPHPPAQSTHTHTHTRCARTRTPARLTHAHAHTHSARGNRQRSTCRLPEGTQCTTL
jgi:hypothetical protein